MAADILVSETIDLADWLIEINRPMKNAVSKSTDRGVTSGLSNGWKNQESLKPAEITCHPAWIVRGGELLCAIMVQE